MNFIFWLNTKFSYPKEKQILCADAMSVRNRNMKHAHAIEFDEANALAML